MGSRAHPVLESHVRTLNSTPGRFQPAEICVFVFFSGDMWRHPYSGLAEIRRNMWSAILLNRSSRLRTNRTVWASMQPHLAPGRKHGRRAEASRPGGLVQGGDPGQGTARGPNARFGLMTTQRSFPVVDTGTRSMAPIRSFDPPAHSERPERAQV